MLFLLKNQEQLNKNSYFFILLHFQHPYCTKARLICLENGFSHSILSMFHVSRNRDIRASPVWRYEELNFEKSSENPQFQHFFDISNEIFFLNQKVQESILADPDTISGELGGKLGLEASKNSIFQKLTSKIGANSNFVVFTKK